MTRLLVLFLALLPLFGQDPAPEPEKAPDPPSVAVLQAENAVLKAQLAEVRAYLDVELQACSDIRLMQARLQLVLSTQKHAAEVAKAKAAAPAVP